MMTWSSLKKHAHPYAFGVLVAAVAGLGGCVGSNQIPQINESSTGFSVYVVDQGTDDVAVLDGLSGALKTKIPVGKTPSALAISGYTGAADRQLWVADSGSDSVSVIDPASNTVVKTIAVGHKPIAMTYRVDGHDRPLMWVLNAGDQSMTAIDTSTKSVVGTFHAGSNPIGITSLTSRNIAAYDVTVLDGDGTLKFYDSTTGSLEQTLQVGSNAVHAAGLDSTYEVLTAAGTVESVGPTNPGGDPNAAADPYLITTSSTVAGTFVTGTHVLFEGTTQQPVVDLYVLAQSNGSHVTFFPLGPGTPQTLPAGTSPQGAGLAYLDGANGKSDQTFIFVANRDSDNISVYDGTPVTIGNELTETFSAGSTFTLAAGSHPVAIAVFGDAPQATPTPSASASSTPTVAPSTSASPTPTPAASAAHLFVVNGNAGSVAEYALPLGATSSPALTVSDAGTLGIAANASYVAVGHPGGSIDIFAQPFTATKAATFAIAAGVCDLAFDAQGNLWAADGSSVVEFSPPFSNATVAAGSATAGINGAYAVTFDAANTMYVANAGNGTVAALAPPYTADAAIVNAPAGARLQGIALNGSSLYVADATNGVIYVYTLPLQSGTGPTGALSLNGPAGIAFDASGNLYATEPGYSALGIFAAPVSGATIPTTFTTGLNAPLGIAISP